ncbi:hypothetical protein NL676_023945 [Syzygium grande]|nr:hypothetical protein NL676_023945 [Syzygium grande]
MGFELASLSNREFSFRSPNRKVQPIQGQTNQRSPAQNLSPMEPGENNGPGGDPPLVTKPILGYGSGGDHVILAAKASPEQRLVALRSGHGRNSPTALGFLGEEDEVSSFETSRHNLINRSNGPGYIHPLNQINGRDFIVGSDGPRSVARSNGSSLILAAPRSYGKHHATSTPAWKGFNSPNSATSSKA